MKPEYHALISLAVASVFYLLTHSLTASAFVILVGVFMDFDHFFDLSMTRGRLTFNPKTLLDYSYNQRYRRLFLVVHSVELIPIIFLLGGILFGKMITYGILVGFISHIITDYATNGVKPFSYFFTYRLLNKFDVSKICNCEDRKDA